MVLRETPPVWRQGFDLYRRRTERDTLGRETAHYAQEPDVRVEAADGLAFQHPRSWNSGGNVGAGEEVRAWGSGGSTLRRTAMRARAGGRTPRPSGLAGRWTSGSFAQQQTNKI